MTPATPRPGSVDQSITEKLNEAGRCFSEGDADCAIELYDEVLAEQPTNAEALTYKGWAQYTLLGDTEAALTTLIEAATRRPGVPRRPRLPRRAVLPERARAAGEQRARPARRPRPAARRARPDRGAARTGRRRARRADHIDHRRLIAQAGGGR